MQRFSSVAMPRVLPRYSVMPWWAPGGSIPCRRPTVVCWPKRTCWVPPTWSRRSSSCAARRVIEIDDVGNTAVVEAGAGTVQAAVRVVEALGNESYVYARTESGDDLVIGDGTITLGMLQDKIDRWIADRS